MKEALAIVAVCTCLFFNCYAQDLKLGARVGFGNSKYLMQEDSEKLHSDKLIKLGASVGFSPFLSNFTIFSGFEFEDRGIGKYLTMPLGVRIFVGQTIRGFAEGGAYYSFLLKDNSKDFNISKDWGVRFGGGITWAVNKRIRADISYHWNHGFANSLKKEKLLPFEQVKTIGSTFRASVFSLGAMYRF